MTTKSVVIFIVILVVVILAVFTFFPKQKPSPPPPPVTEITPPTATGNVDDLVAATIKEITDEEILLKEAENDPSFITSDSQEISSFGQTINESEF
jgi:hypothetical protein